MIRSFVLKRFRFCVFLILCLWAMTTHAQHWDRESAFSMAPQSWQVGVFNPLRYSIDETWSIEGHPLAAVFLPSVHIYQRLMGAEQWQFTGHYGIALPSQTLKHALPFGLRGYLSPSCLVEKAEPQRDTYCEEAGASIAPTLGGLLSYKDQWTYTVDFDVSGAFLLDGPRPKPLDTYAPLEMVFAPLTHEYRTHLGFRASRWWHDGFATAFEFDVYRMGKTGARSPWVFSGYTGFDWRVTTRLTLTMGAIYWNSDQRAMRLKTDAQGYAKKVLVRSHDLYPTFDLIWRF